MKLHLILNEFLLAVASVTLLFTGLTVEGVGIPSAFQCAKP